MLVLIDSNENTDREKGRTDRDKRTDSSNLRVVTRLKKLFPKAETASLTCGDINVILDNGQLLAIERKRAGDFLGSIGNNGHIFKQVENMAKNAKWSCVILEGNLSFDADDMTVIPVFDKNDNQVGTEVTGWRGASVRAAMYSIQWSGCPIFATHPLMLPQMVADLASFCMKPSEHQTQLGRHRYVTFPPVELKEEVIASFPGVGLKRARSLIAFAASKSDNGNGRLGEAISWGSMLNLLDRKVRPEGWGDKTIENFRATLGLETGEFLTIEEDKQQKPQKKGKK